MSAMTLLLLGAIGLLVLALAIEAIPAMVEILLIGVAILALLHWGTSLLKTSSFPVEKHETRVLREERKTKLR